MGVRYATELAAACVAMGALMSLGCVTADCPEPQPVAAADPTTEQRLAEEIAALRATAQANEAELALEQLKGQELEARVAELERERDSAKQELEQSELALTSLEERYAALEIELTSAVEEVLRAMARVRTVKTRALAVSRIAEVRVQLEAVPDADDQEVAARLQRASDFLTRADAVLEEGNYGGASFLAERANDLVRQARMVREIRASANGQPQGVIAIVPPRPMEVLESSNLREGPGADTRRVGSLPQGSEVVAVARSGEWFQVQTESGLKAWIAARLVR